MKFQVPQFIEVEDKIFGPLTFKQFVYLAGGAGMCFIFWSKLPHLVAPVFVLPIAAFSLALAFYKINNKPFIAIVEAFFRYSIGSKLYIWKKEPRKVIEKKEEDEAVSGLYVPRLSDSRLKDIAWQLDVHDRMEA